MTSFREKLTRSMRRKRNRFRKYRPIHTYFPRQCEKCEFVAADVDEMVQHEHANDYFVKK